MLASRNWPYVLGSDDQIQKVQNEMLGWSNRSDALGRPPFNAEDVPLFNPDLDNLFHDLDEVVLKTFHKDAHRHAAVFRVGSIAAHRQQVDFYFRLAQSPGVRTIMRWASTRDTRLAFGCQQTQLLASTHSTSWPTPSPCPPPTC